MGQNLWLFSAGNEKTADNNIEARQGLRIILSGGKISENQEG